MKTQLSFLSKCLLLFCLFLFSKNVSAQLNADFTYTYNCGTVTFTDQSTGNIVSWHWDFDDGTTSTLQNPVHTYIRDSALAILTVTDTSGTQDVRSIYLQTGLISSFINGRAGTCGLCNGFVSVDAWGGQWPFTYSWNTGDSVLVLQGLCDGTYTVTITDAVSCTATESITIVDTVPPLQVTAVVDSPSCGICDGSITANISGGSPPYYYHWNTGSDTTTTISGLCPGVYSLTVYSSTQCMDSFEFTLSGVAACFDTISGTVYFDDNGNCVQDAAEDGIPNFLVDLTPGGAVYTDANGNYTFIRDTGTYVVEAVLPNFFSAICPPSGSYTIHLDTSALHSSGNDFALEIIPVQDLSASVFCGVARPGFQQWSSFTVSNAGTVTMSGTAELHIDSRLTFVSATPPPDNMDIVNNIFSWNFSNLGMNQALTVSFVAQVPAIPTVNLGDTLYASLLVNPVSGDVDSLNNLSECFTIVRGSYDPNDKAVFPQGETSEGFITQDDTLLYYTIRFQNTGTDTAFNVVIKDTLDSDLAWPTFRHGTASHPYTVQFPQDDVLEFTFKNILLPDSNVNEPASHGHVTFYIKHDGILPLTTVITNRAAIYFDFNLPVITNTVTNKIFEPTGVHEFHTVSNSIRLYPNPASEGVTVESTDDISQLFIRDLAGKRMYESADVNKKTLVVTTRSLPAGLYLLGIQTKAGLEIRRLVVQK